MKKFEIKTITIIILIVTFLVYSFSLYSSLPVKSYKTSSAAVKGKILWQQKNCNACHQFYGLGGYLGPDLTNVYSKRTEAYISTFIRNGTTVMPAFEVTDDELHSLLQFLKETDASGNSDPRSFRKDINGTIHQ